MPYIHVNTSKKLSDTRKDDIAAALGQKISLIPGKSESSLMVGISDGDAMYFRGKRDEFAYINVEIYGTAPIEAQKEFTEAVFGIMQDCAGLMPNQVYVTINEHTHWGVSGSMK